MVRWSRREGTTAAAASALAPTCSMVHILLYRYMCLNAPRPGELLRRGTHCDASDLLPTCAASLPQPLAVLTHMHSRQRGAGGGSTSPGTSRSQFGIATRHVEPVGVLRVAHGHCPRTASAVTGSAPVGSGPRDRRRRGRPRGRLPTPTPTPTVSRRHHLHGTVPGADSSFIVTE